jgi:ATP-binding cassette subfamily B protein
MTVLLQEFCWPANRAAEVLEVLAQKSGLKVKPGLTGQESYSNDQSIEAMGGCLGLEAEPVQIMYGEIDRQLPRLGPALLRLFAGDRPVFLALLRGRRRLRVLAPDLKVRKLPAEMVRAALCREIEAPLQEETDRLLREAGIPNRYRARVERTILLHRLNTSRIENCWLLRLPPGASFWQQLKLAGIPARFAGLTIAHALQYSLWILAWWLVGAGALEGRLDQGWMLAWALMLLTLVPLRLLTTWLEGMLAIGAGGLLRQRLLGGALQLEPEEIRTQGAGQLLGRVIESEAVESLALSGGLLSLVALIEIIMAGVVLAVGAGGGLHVLVLVFWIVVTLLLGWRYYRRYSRWTNARLHMTHDLVERMVGHRTCLAQERPEHWHDGEDQAVDRYVELSKEMDQGALLLTALAPRGWLALGILGLAPAFVSGSGSPAGLAIGLGGALLAHRALKRLASGLQHLVGAVMSWRQVSQLFGAASRSEAAHFLPYSGQANSIGVQQPRDGNALLEAHELAYRFQTGRNWSWRTAVFGFQKEIGPFRRRKVDFGCSGHGPASPSVGPPFHGRPGSPDTRSAWLARASGSRAPVSRKPCADGDLFLQSVDGTILATSPGGSRGS